MCGGGVEDDRSGRRTFSPAHSRHDRRRARFVVVVVGAGGCPVESVDSFFREQRWKLGGGCFPIQATCFETRRCSFVRFVFLSVLAVKYRRLCRRYRGQRVRLRSSVGRGMRPADSPPPSPWSSWAAAERSAADCRGRSPF